MFPPASPNEVIQLTSDTPAAGLLHPGEDWCSEFNGIEDSYYESSKFVEYWKELEPKYRKTFEDNGIKWTPKIVKKFTAFVIVVECTEHNLSSWINEDIKTMSSEFVSRHNYGINEQTKYIGVGASPLFREIFRISDGYISMENTFKFCLHSTHDTAIASILPVFNFSESFGPAFRSHIAFEIWKKDLKLFGRFVFNGKPVRIPFLDNQELFSYSALKLELSKRGILNHCLIPEWTKY